MLEFEILIDTSFEEINTDGSLAPIENKSVLSIVNDFENAAWRYDKFQSFVWDNIAETALSFGERQRLIDKSHTSLIESAKNLRLTDKNKDETGQGSELAEIVLYGIMKNHFNALSVVPKIFYKQNSQDNAKGADSVHIVLEGENDFSIWFGEAKFYNSIEDARLASIIASVENSLDVAKLRKENSIIANVSDINGVEMDESLRQRIKNSLLPTESIDSIKPKLHIPILLLHECEITRGCKEMSEEYRDNMMVFHKERAEAYFKKQINKIAGIHKYSEIKFHIILFPVASKEEIVNLFVSNVEHYKRQANNGNI